ncbi:hypothetical protein KP509_14G027200 [Ceratopteris richardii]|nr:hypothetical protein KP509_14G027200 [Ceratopteris richardii]
MFSLHTKMDLLAGKRLHSCLLQDSIASDVVMGTALLTMYGRHGRVGLAEGVFYKSKEQDVALWNAMMNIYAQSGEDSCALQLFYKMNCTQWDPDKVTYICVLGACARLFDLEMGRIIHISIANMKLENDSMVVTTLVNMYGKCSSVDDAQDLFDQLIVREVATWNTLIDALITHGKDEQAIYMFKQMHEEGVFALKPTFVSILGALHSEVFLWEGKHMHVRISACGILSDKVVATALFGMYGSCGSIENAEDIFEGMVERSKISWNAMISECLQNKCGEKAFCTFEKMIWEGQVPDKVTYLNMLLACTLIGNFQNGIIMHTFIHSSNYNSEVAVTTALVGMYAKFGHLDMASRLFDTIKDRNIISWNSIVRAHVQSGLNEVAFQLIEQLKQEGFMPNGITLSLSLLVCCNEAGLLAGKQMHACMLRGNLESELVSMYARCGNLQNAILLFQSIHSKDISTWNNLIHACTQRGLEALSFQILNQMQVEGVIPNVFTCTAILDMCCTTCNIKRCQQLHACILHGDLKEDATIASSLIKTYGACGNLLQARAVFNCASDKDEVIWNTMMGVYSRQHQETITSILQLHSQMHQECHIPTRISYINCFSVCASSSALREGMQFHSCIRHSELELDTVLRNSLIFMYGKCGCHEISDKLFIEFPKWDRVTWGSMIAIYAEIGDSMKALQLFHSMAVVGNILPDRSTIISTLSSCASSSLLVDGKLLHAYITSLKLDADAEIINSLMNMYGKCGDLEDALALFVDLSAKDTCSWNTIIAVLLYHGHDTGAIQLFKRMQQESVNLCDITYACVLSACGDLSSLTYGRLVHHSIICNSEIESQRTVANAIISMYGKCGSLKDALSQSLRLSIRDTISWNAIIFGYAQHGYGEESVALLRSMQKERTPPDEVSFLTTILACSHSGLVDVACHLWISMCEDLKIKPGAEHFSCLVDTFSRAGRLFDARQFIANMPYQPCSVSWTTLLSACRNYVDALHGLQVAPYILEIDPDEFPTQSMLSNVRSIAVRLGHQEMDTSVYA